MRTMHKHVIHQKLWFPNENMPILYNWSILEIDSNWNAAISDIRLNYEIVMVDWLWVWDVWKAVLDERHMMAQNWSIYISFIADEKTKKAKKKTCNWYKMIHYN
jgi:mRNA degradation ribonuclease J1/J2